MKAKIKSVQIISATEVGELYQVGENGVTEIKLFENQVNQYEYNPIYRIFKGESLYAEVAHNCPIEIKYEFPE
jgi:hypothetical protein